MKRPALLSLAILFVSIVGFIFGRTYQHMKSGHYYEVRTERDIAFGIAPVSIRYVTESVGLPFLDPGTSVVTMNDAKCGPITLYKAKRVFQEDWPFAQDLAAKDKELAWNDGVYSYVLKIEPMDDKDSEAQRGDIP